MSTESTSRRILLHAARLLVAAALLTWVLSRVHWHDYPATDDSGAVVSLPGIATGLRSVSVPHVAAALTASILSLLVAALRWRALLRVQGVSIGVAESFRLGFLGELFNTLIPGMVGGDAVKAYYVARGTQRRAEVVVTVLVDRLMGVCGLAAFAWVALAAVSLDNRVAPGSLRAALLSAVAVTAGLTATAVFVLSARLRRVLRLDRLYKRLPVARHVAAAAGAVTCFRQNRRAIAAAGALTLVAQTLGIGSVALVGMGLGLAVPWHVYFAYVPLVMILSALPVTPGGIGVMEELYLLYFAAAGSASSILVLALLVRAVLLCGALPGIVVAAVGPGLPSAEAVRRALGE
jgi:glycosyltransferase 2 family protein